MPVLRKLARERAVIVTTVCKPVRAESVPTMVNATQELQTRFVHPRKWNAAAPFWVVALSLGLIQTWANRFYMGNDGVSYLDMADAYLRGDWHTAINGSWNPLYSWLISLDFLIFHPSAYWEYPSVQLLNFAIYAATLASFEYFLRGILAWKRGDEIALRVIGYGLFLWSSLTLIGVWTVNADMLVAACFYTAMGLLLRAHSPEIASAPKSVMLGMTLAAGYYSKAVMFPLSLAVLFIAWKVIGWRRALTATSTFILLSVPLIAGVSTATGHLTIGDTGRVNYAWYVNGVASRWWQGGPAGSGQPQHPPRILLESPRLYEFDGVFARETYPIWYDFSYWYKGLRVWFDARRLVKVMWSNLEWTSKMLARQGGGFLLGCAICFLLCKNKAQILKDFAATWPAWTASMAAFLLYSAVHIERRYIGAPAAVLLLSVYVAAQVKEKWLAGGIAVLSLGWAIVFAPAPTLGARYLPSSSASGNVSWEAAVGLQKLGLRTNDKVASVCYSNRSNVFWARLARVHIVAETDWAVNFWQLSEVDQRRVLEAFASSGARMAIADETPPDPAHAMGWRRAGSTNYFAYSLSQLLEPAQNSAIPSGVDAGQPAIK
jgi:hypothetical protein